MKHNQKAELILVGPHSLPHGGIQSYFVQLLAQLRLNGYSTYVLDTRSSRDACYQSGLMRATQRALKYLSLMLKLMMVEGRIVHCLSSSYGNFYANGLLIIFGKMLGRKTVISMLGGGWPSVVQNAGALRRFLITLVFRFVDAIIACNEQIRKSIVSLDICDRKIVRISNALPFNAGAGETMSSEIQGFLDRHSPVITSVSAFLPEYGVMTLIKAAMQLKSKFHNTGLIVIVLAVSDKKIFHEVHSFLQKNQLCQNVLIVRNVHSTSAVIKRSDLFVRTNLLDGDSVSVREALFLGIPVVASDTAFRPRDVVLFKKGDAHDCYMKMRRVVENPQRFSPKYAAREAHNNLERIERIYTRLGTCA